MKKIDVIPTCFYHPITVLFLDDDRGFLDTVELELRDRGNLITCTDPQKAIDILTTHREDLNQRVLKIPDKNNVDTMTDHLVDIEITHIHHCIYDRKRFDNIAIVVVDYQMPNVNGIEFCRQINDKTIFKIMLTAEADKDTAISAFNAGIIDKFVFKKQDQLVETLTGLIDELKQSYFETLSQTIIDSMGGPLKSLFANSAYKKLFAQVYASSQAVEYYLMDASGSFMFLDKNGDPTWLLIRSHQEIRNQRAFIEEYDMPKTILSALQADNKILFMLSEDEYKKPVESWGTNIHDAQPLGSDFYYSIINHKLTDAVHWDQIESYVN